MLQDQEALPGLLDGIVAVPDPLGDPEALRRAGLFRRGLTKGNASEGMAVAHRLSQPSYDEQGNLVMSAEQKMEYLASLSPAQLEATLDEAHRWMSMEYDIGRRLAAQYANAPRRHTRAPTPFKAPRGGAAPPKNIEALANKTDISDYVKHRQQQLKRGEG
jgi:hypothetical protein